MPLPLAAIAHCMPVIIACGVAVIFDIGIHLYLGLGVIEPVDRKLQR